MGMRATALQVDPSEEELMTMSLEAHPERKRQSDHTTKTLPAPSMLAEGRLGLRRPAATKWLWTLAIALLLPQLRPVVERLTATSPILLELELSPARGRVEISHWPCFAS